MSEQPSQPFFILVTGIMAAGKSTIAQRLAERLPRSVHLRGDAFRRMIVNGQAEMAPNLSPEARSQLRLRYDLAASAARRYLQAGFAVVYQDIVIGKDLQDVVRSFGDLDMHVVILSPAAHVVAERDSARAKTGYSREFDPHAFDRSFRDETPRLGLMLDTTDLTADETVDRILANLDEALVGN